MKLLAEMVVVASMFLFLFWVVGRMVIDLLYWWGM